MALKFQSFFFFFTLVLSIPTSLQDQGFVSVTVSKLGLDYAKNLATERAISSMIPLEIPQIVKAVSVPLLGRVDVVLSNITIDSIEVGSSFVESGESGVVLAVSGAKAKLGMDWSYEYSSWFVEASDYGNASVQVQNMNVGLTLALEEHGGSVKLSVLDSGCYVRGIVIKMNGGASWLYQEFIDAFQDVIQSRVEEAVSKKIKEEISKLNSLLQTLPKEFPVHDEFSMNVTLVGNPVLTNASIKFDINGLFIANVSSFGFLDGETVHHIASNENSTKMVEISLHENVFDSISSVFFNAGYLRWLVDKVTDDQSILNTSWWKHIIPKLYKQYPDKPMSLDISVSSPPTVKVSRDDIDVAIYSDVVVNVLDDGDEILPVLCLSLEISASGSPKMVDNKLAGTLALRDFDINLESSKVGNLRMRLIKSAMSIILKTLVFPYANLQLREGFQLPAFHGFVIQNAQVSCTDSKLLISGDVLFLELQSVARQIV